MGDDGLSAALKYRLIRLWKTCFGLQQLLHENDEGLDHAGLHRRLLFHGLIHLHDDLGKASQPGKSRIVQQQLQPLMRRERRAGDSFLLPTFFVDEDFVQTEKGVKERSKHVPVKKKCRGLPAMKKEKRVLGNGIMLQQFNNPPIFVTFRLAGSFSRQIFLYDLPPASTTSTANRCPIGSKAGNVFRVVSSTKPAFAASNRQILIQLREVRFENIGVEYHTESAFLGGCAEQAFFEGSADQLGNSMMENCWLLITFTTMGCHEDEAEA